MALPGHHLWVRFKVSLWSLTAARAAPAQRGPLPLTVDSDPLFRVQLNSTPFKCRTKKEKKKTSRTQYDDVNLCKYSLIAETSEHASVETTSHGYINLRKNASECMFIFSSLYLETSCFPHSRARLD